MLVYVDDTLLGDVLRLALHEAGPPLEMTANVLAAAAVVAAVRNPDWASAIARGADAALVDLADRIAGSYRETSESNPRAFVDELAAGLVPRAPGSEAKAG